MGAKTSVKALADTLLGCSGDRTRVAGCIATAPFRPSPSPPRSLGIFHRFPHRDRFVDGGEASLQLRYGIRRRVPPCASVKVGSPASTRGSFVQVREDLTPELTIVGYVFVEVGHRNPCEGPRTHAGKT